MKIAFAAAMLAFGLVYGPALGRGFIKDAMLTKEEAVLLRALFTFHPRASSSGHEPRHTNAHSAQSPEQMAPLRAVPS